MMKAHLCIIFWASLQHLMSIFSKIIFNVLINNFDQFLHLSSAFTEAIPSSLREKAGLSM
ncbi:hypothetical protein EO95_02095 [Methanosarcina sp. 1.H.T.1A.1]|nr:hypothetical protein EO95_02095 [Methanosarcina sp. 1.H.T.1A.1]